MVVRQSWRRSIARAEGDTYGKLNDLVASEVCPPVDVIGVSEEMGARVERARFDGSRRGSLARVDGEWVIRLRGDPTLLEPSDRFTIAHELAHLLLLEGGITRPVSTDEYWFLEAVCDRIAGSLLVPWESGPSGPLQPSQIKPWFGELVDRWQLSNEDAARTILQRASNCQTAAIVIGGSGTSYVAWSHDLMGSLDLRHRTYCEAGYLTELESKVDLDPDSWAEVRIIGSIIVGFEWGRIVRNVSTHARPMVRDATPEDSALDRGLMVFELTEAGQLEFPF